MLIEGGAAMDVRKDKTSYNCKLQAAFIESAVVAVLLYEAILALEMAVITSKFKTGEHMSNYSESNRHIVYHLFAILIIVLVAVVPYIYDDSTQTNGAYHCHYELGPSEIFIFLPALLSIVTVMVANIYSVRNILTMMAVFMPTSGQNNDILERVSAKAKGSGAVTRGSDVDGSDDADQQSNICCSCCGYFDVCAWFEQLAVVRFFWHSSDTYQRFDAYTRRTVMRIVIQPLLYTCLLIISATLRVTTSSSVGNFATLSLILVMAPANAILWIFNDDIAISAWLCMLTGRAVVSHSSGGGLGRGNGDGNHGSNSGGVGSANMSSANTSNENSLHFGGSMSFRGSESFGNSNGYGNGNRLDRLLSAGSHMSDVAGFTTGDHVPRLGPLIRGPDGDPQPRDSMSPLSSQQQRQFSTELV